MFPILEPWVVDLITIAEVLEDEYVTLSSATEFQVGGAYVCADKMIYCRGVDSCNQRVYFSQTFGG